MLPNFDHTFSWKGNYERMNRLENGTAPVFDIHAMIRPEIRARIKSGIKLHSHFFGHMWCKC